MRIFGVRMGAVYVFAAVAMFFASVVVATPVYQSVANNLSNPTYGSGIAEIGNAGVPDYGKVGVAYHYWQDQTTNYWYYTYQIINNTTSSYAGGSKDIPPVDYDYHFGWDVDDDPDTYKTIHKFGINFYNSFDGVFWHGPDDLYILGDAGSTAGGGQWGHTENPLFNADVDWTVSLGQGDPPATIAPTRWEWIGGSDKYWQIH